MTQQPDSPRLLDDGLLDYEVSIAGTAERYGRGTTSHTIHVWWARRPHTAMRALVFSSLAQAGNDRAEELLRRLGSEPEVPPLTLEEARNYIADMYASPPKVLDMFGGGGTIPHEALNIGAEAHAIEHNELAVFIQRCNLVYGVNSNATADLIRNSGKRVLGKLEDYTDSFFPLRDCHVEGSGGRPITGYIWTYSTECSRCNYQFYLTKRPWLSRKNGRRVGLVRRKGEGGERISIEAGLNDDELPETPWKGRTGNVVCPNCNNDIDDISIKNCHDELVALVASERGRGKEFLAHTSEAVPAPDVLRDAEQLLRSELSILPPRSKLPNWSGIVNPSLYGIDTHNDFLNRRQRVVSLSLCKALCEEYAHLEVETDDSTAKHVVGLLSAFIDQSVDWNSRLSMWIPQNEQVGRAFCGPGVSMIWDYTETDPVKRGPSNLHDKLDRIVEGAKWTRTGTRPAKIRKGSALDLPYDADSFDAIVTDPPYYDNVFYSVLADFFYTWKRPVLKKLEPTLFEADCTDNSEELVASTFRNGSQEAAHEEYCENLQAAVSEAERVVKPDAPVVWIYSHASLNGWEALVRAFQLSGLQMTGVAPLSIERRQRPRAMTSKAINVCVGFIARKQPCSVSPLNLNNTAAFVAETASQIFVPLKEAGWSESSIGVALFANGAAALANKESVNAEDLIDQLVRLEEEVSRRAPSFSLSRRGSL